MLPFLISFERSDKSASELAILAGIMVTDDLFRERAKKTEHKNNTASDDEAEKQTIEMIKKLEQALNAK